MPNEVQRSLGRIEGRLGGIDANLNRIVERLDTHSKRLGGVEASLANIKGKATVWGLIAGTSVSVLFSLIKEKILKV